MTVSNENLFSEVIFGLNEFNIQKPRTRSYPYDAVFQDTIRSTGNLATEHNYVKVTVNGSDWGVMNLESHIDKEFLERNQKKESLVVRFSNEDGWLYEKTSPRVAPKYYRLSDPLLFSKVYGGQKFFDRSKLNVEDFEKQYQDIISLINTNAPVKTIIVKKNEEEIMIIFNEIIKEIKKIDLRLKIDTLEEEVASNLDENLYSELLSLRNQLKSG